MDNAAEGINVGIADLTLSGGLTLTNGNIGIGRSGSGVGKIVLGNTSTIAADGTLDLGGALVLNAGLSVLGTLKTDNATTLTLNNNALNLSGGQAANGGVLETSGALTLDGITFDDKTTIKLNANTLLTNSSPITVKTIDMGTYSLGLGSATTDLTITDNFTINSSGSYNSGFDTGLADLTLNGPVTVSSSGIMSTGGTVKFGAGANGSSFEEQTWMSITDTSLDLETDLYIHSLQLNGTSSLQANGKKLSFHHLGTNVQTELDFTDIETDNNSSLSLYGNTSIKKTGALEFKRIAVNGNTLTLNTSITSLTARDFYTSDNNPNSPNYLTNTGKLLAQGVDVKLTKKFWLDKGKIEMGGGTLTLDEGGGLGLSLIHI